MKDFTGNEGAGAVEGGRRRCLLPTGRKSDQAKAMGEKLRQRTREVIGVLVDRGLNEEAIRAVLPAVIGMQAHIVSLEHENELLRAQCAGRN